MIVKHNNPSGVAIAEDVADAYEKALACDPLSAYGGVIALNRPVDAALAERLHENFIEVLIAPSYDEAGIEVLKQKEAVRILEDTEQRAYIGERDLKRVRGGAARPGPRLGRGHDVGNGRRLEGRARGGPVGRPAVRVARRAPRALERDRDREGRRDARDRRGADEPHRLGASSRSTSAHQARGDEAAGAPGGLRRWRRTPSSPSPTGPQVAIDAGVSAFIQPGGSKRDSEVVGAADDAGAAMVLTGRRHFRH